MHELDDPILASLRGPHRGMALVAGPCVRYPPEVAPFLACEAASGEADPHALVAAGETVYLLGEAPRVAPAWSLRSYPELAQMVCEAPLAPVAGPGIALLGESDRAQVLELTALVYPHYFRPRTMDLGRYFGIHLDGRLAAIIGERMATDASQEISAVCTHPDFLGRGLARCLLAFLANDVLAQGRLPFLHVSHANERAKSLYERNGFRVRRDIGFHSLQRA
jgi:ribosomal protein S18 acetylase RimI-like enzyme